VGEPAVATILFTDLVDSTGLLERLGEDGALQVQRDHLALLRKAVADHGGEELKSLGDGIMAVFASAVGAVSAAVAMQRAVASGQPGVGLRVGLDAGEQLPNEGDLYGTSVVVARRLCDHAAGSQIIVTDLVRSLVGRRLQVAMTPLGPTQLKGLTAPVQTWLVHWD
jgi:class 3 adenylate cyclase